MKRIMGILLLVFGILFVGYQLASDFLFQQRAKINHTQEITAEQMAENETREVENDFEAITNVSALDAFTELSHIKPEFVVGQLVIPAMKRDLPISKGINDENLLIGVATLKDGQKLGQGNFAVAGHNHRIPGSLLNGFDNIGMGIDLYATNKDKIYHYITYDRVVTEADAFEYLEDEVAKEHGKPIFTMLTCALPIVEDQRVFILSELVQIIDYSEEKMTELMNNGQVTQRE
ncbi:MAG: class A sortase [Tissierellia bacterium]|nr:class A sortase [Tissierellia bacterium]